MKKHATESRYVGEAPGIKKGDRGWVTGKKIIFCWFTELAGRLRPVEVIFCLPGHPLLDL